VKVVRTRRGIRLVQRGIVLSEVLERPGPTNTLFVVLAAAVSALAPGPRVAILGFAAGGIVAPLRALGFHRPIAAVDRDTEGEALFRHLSDAWAGEVRVSKADAVEWLRRSGAPFDLILEDLTIERDDLYVTKPRATWETLPSLIARRLTPAGIAVVNLLPVPGMSWADLVSKARAPWRRACVALLADYENRIVLAGRHLEEAGVLSRRLRGALRALGSSQADQVTVRTL
jgi:hypothetical protein